MTTTKNTANTIDTLIGTYAVREEEKEHLPCQVCGAYMHHTRGAIENPTHRQNPERFIDPFGLPEDS